MRTNDVFEHCPDSQDTDLECLTARVRLVFQPDGTVPIVLAPTSATSVTFALDSRHLSTTTTSALVRMGCLII